jgi:tryptophanase
VGLQEVLSEDYLRYRIATAAYMGERIKQMGVPTVRPTGGHAVYIDAAKFLPHIPREQFPGQSLACELYLQDGIRSCEIGSVMFKEAATMELVRLAFPRRVYTQSHFDYILEGFEELVQRRQELRGYRIAEAPPFLRHFTAKFDRL